MIKRSRIHARVLGAQAECRRSVPSVQRLIDFLEDGFVELEQAAGFSPGERSPVGRAAATA